MHHDYSYICMSKVSKIKWLNFISVLSFAFVPFSTLNADRFISSIFTMDIAAVRPAYKQV